MATQKVNIEVSTKGAKKSKQELSGLNGAISKMGKAVGIASAAYFGARGLISGLQRVIDLSATFDVVSRGFENLAKNSNFSSSAFDKLRKATDGTVSSIELMTQANNAMLLGITDSEDQMAEMFDIAQRLASALGKDTAFGVESLVTGLGRQSKLMLDNLGIMVDVETANKNYAKSINKNVKELTDQEKKQAFVNETLKSARELVNGLGEEQLTTNDTVLQLKSAFDDLGISIGNKLSPLVKFLASDFISLTESLNDFIGPETISKEQQLNALLQQRGQLLGDENEKRKEAVDVADLFTNEALEANELEKETLDIGLKLLDDQIKNYHDLIFAKKESTLEIKKAQDAEINFGAVVKKVAVNNKMAYNELIGAKRKLIKEDIRGAIIAGQTAEQAMTSVVRAELMEAISGLMASIMKNTPFPINLALAAGAGALATSALERNLAVASKFKFAEGGIVPGVGNQDTVPAMLTPGEVILNQAQQQNLVNGMGITINIQGNVLGTREFVRDTLVPEISRAVRYS